MGLWGKKAKKMVSNPPDTGVLIYTANTVVKGLLDVLHLCF